MSESWIEYYLLWTVKAMQQMLNTKDITEDPTRASAFHPVTPVTKSPRTPRRYEHRKRDSGYGSDFSPASVKSVKRVFTFDDTEEDIDHELSDDMGAMDIRDSFEDEDVFIQEHPFEPEFGAIPEVDESDDTDKEVEELLNEAAVQRPVFDPSAVQPRPPAPLPTPEVADGVQNIEIIERNSDNLRLDSHTECLIASPFYHTQWCIKDRVLCKNPFRPIVSRSVGTQTPNPHCHLIQNAIGTTRRPEPVRHIHRGNLRLRMPSDIESFSRLPDVIPPMSRDRSISLPDVESFHRREEQLHVGRELRRISDAFINEYAVKAVRKRTRSCSGQSSSSGIRGYFRSIRRIVSTSSFFQSWGRDDGDDADNR